MNTVRKVLLKRTLIGTFGSLAIVCILLKGLDWLYPLAALNNPDRFSRVVLAEDGRVLRAFADERGVWRHPITLSQTSPNFIQALLEYEDKHFYWHPGINPFSLLRASWQNAKCGCIVSGGSTLTMQVARIFYPHPKTLSGKFKQSLRALQLEWHLSKDEILTLYLNNAPYGGTIEGVQAAAQTYLEKNANELTDAEAALLAVLPQAPSRLRPDRHPTRALSARNKVLNRLKQQSTWSIERVESAALEPIHSVYNAQVPRAPLLSRHLSRAYPNARAINTFIDYDLQADLQTLARERVSLMPSKSSLAFLVRDNKSGHIKAYVGSADFADQNRYGHVDMIRAIRSPGSTLKPFIYGLAIDEGIIHSHSLLMDAPRIYGEYRPNNFSGGFHGAVSATAALQKSLNVPAVQVLEHLDPHVLYGKLKHVDTPIRLSGKPNLSMALGGVGSSLLDLVTLYSSLANKGLVSPSILSASQATTNSRYLMSDASAFIVHNMLASAPRPDQLNSYAIAKTDNPIAWKTGTSFGYRDSWAIGVSQEYTVGVWVGRPDGTPIPGHYGAITAVPLLFEVMEGLPNRHSWVPKPNNVSRQSICWPTGHLKSQLKPSQCHTQHMAWVKDMNIPPTLAEPGLDDFQRNPLRIWINAESGNLIDQSCTATNKEAREIAVWPRNLEPWLPARWHFRNQIPKVDESCDHPPSLAVRPLKITGIETGSTLHLSQQQSTLLLETQGLGGSGRLDWYLNGVYVNSSENHHRFQFTIEHAGTWELVALDEQGQLDRVQFDVIDQK